MGPSPSPAPLSEAPSTQARGFFYLWIPNCTGDLNALDNDHQGGRVRGGRAMDVLGCFRPKGSGRLKFRALRWQVAHEAYLPPKGNTEGYTWQFDSVIQNSNLSGERGTAGEGGYFTIAGKIAAGRQRQAGSSGIVASRKYARGVLAHKGEEYGYKVKAQFKDTEGTGTRDEGLGS